MMTQTRVIVTSNRFSLSVPPYNSKTHNIYIERGRYESSNKSKYEEYYIICKEWITDKLNYLFHWIKKSNIDEENLSSLNTFIDEVKTEIKDSTNNIANFLKSQHILKEEYYDFKEIQRMINNALSSNNKFKIQIISMILEKLIEITSFKFYLLFKDNISCELDLSHIPEEDVLKFKNEYKKFHKFLFDSKRKFYTNEKNELYGSSKKYFNLMKDELIN